MIRLKTVVANPVVKLNDPDLPYVALEHIESHVGRLLPGVELESKDADDSVAHQIGDVRFGKLRPYLAKSILTDSPGVGSGELLVLRPGPEIDPRYLWLLTLSRPFLEYANASSYGVKMPRTSWEALGNFRLAVPPLDEQRRIVEVLDAETSRIDELIYEQKRLLDLVNERFYGRHLEMVIRGHTPAKDLSPSRILGGALTPVSWNICRLRALPVDIQTGPFGSQLHQHDYVDVGFPVVNPANLVGGMIRPIEGMAVSKEVRDRLSSHVLRAGDVVFGRRGEMGRAGLVTEVEDGWLCGTGSIKIRFTEPIFHSGFLKRYLETSLLKQHLEVMSVGSTMDNLNSAIVGRIPILVPPLDVQERISAELDELEASVEDVRITIRHSLELLAEHRQALITAAVTGGLDAVKKVA